MAVPLPDDARDSCRRVLEAARTSGLGRGARWVQVDTLHLTLRFLGDTPPALVPDVATSVGEALEAMAPVDVRLGGAGAFPGGRKVRTLWLGIERGAEGLAALAGALAAPLAALGWSEEVRPFRPHLTVARLDATPIGEGQLVAQALEAAAEGWSTAFRADRVVLYRSHLGGGPARHEAVREVVLRG